jgi:hypothetical protein
MPAERISSDAEVVDLAETLRGLVPVQAAADAPMVTLLAVTMTRAARALGRVERLEADGELPPQRLLDDLRGWVAQSARLCDQLGLSPTSRARLGVDLASAQRQLSIVELHAAAAAERDGGA